MASEISPPPQKLCWAPPPALIQHEARSQPLFGTARVSYVSALVLLFFQSSGECRGTQCPGLVGAP